MTRTLLIDNYDSFTYNLYALIAEVTGAQPLVVRNDGIEWRSVQTLDIDRIVISPGPGRVHRRADLGLSADAILHSELPVLGVCLGHQAIGHFFGADVCCAREPFHGRACEVIHSGEDLFYGLPSPFRAVRYHSWEVLRLPAELQATAWTKDGTLMALRHRSRPLWGVQFHPESISTEYGAQILRRFVELGGEAHPRSTPARPAPATAQVTAPQAMMLRLFAVALDGAVSAEAAFTALFGASSTAFWLDSSSTADHRGRFSYMGDATGPRAETLRYRHNAATLEIKCGETTAVENESIFSYLARRSSQYQLHPERPALPFEFCGGYVGYFGYELKGELTGATAHAAETDDACWLFADRFVAFDHASATSWLVCLDQPEGLCEQNRLWLENARRKLAECAKHVARERGSPASAGTVTNLRWRHAPEQYRQLILKAKEAIRLGESYEICLTNQIAAECSIDPLTAYVNLRRVNPAPYSAFLRFGSLCVLCSSPELFLAISARGEVTSKPIKGTAARSSDVLEDERRARELAGSVKNQAENLMIVDLLRNDLNRVCTTGSVHVPALFAIESFQSVHQLVSTICGTLRTATSAVDCIRATFPGGSMTGAPKIRTMAILDELECGPRGVYSGSLGYLAVSGAAQLNIVIRTLVMNGQKMTIGTGGAITALSDPHEEFAEVILKVRALLQALSVSGASVDIRTLIAEDPPAEALKQSRAG